MLIPVQESPSCLWENRDLIEDELEEEEKEDDSEDDQRPSPQWAQAKKSTDRERFPEGLVQVEEQAAIEKSNRHFEDADLERIFKIAVGMWLNGQETFPLAVGVSRGFRGAGGFDGIVGNPPFMGGQKITGNLNNEYREFLVSYLASGKRGSADLCAYFFLRGLFGLRCDCRV